MFHASFLARQNALTLGCVTYLTGSLFGLEGTDSELAVLRYRWCPGSLDKGFIKKLNAAGNKYVTCFIPMGCSLKTRFFDC